MAKAKSEVEQEDKAPKREDQRQGKLKEAPPLVVAAISATVSFVVVVDGLAPFCI